MSIRVDCEPAAYPAYTDETDRVEAAFRAAGYTTVSAYRYNAACIRVRVIDPVFAGKRRQRRQDWVDPVLATLPADIERDIITVIPVCWPEVRTDPQSRTFDREAPA